MKNYLSLLISVAVFSLLSCTRSAQDNGVKIMAYYFPHWGSFHPEALPPDKLTHIIFSFTEVIGNEMKFADDSSGLMLKKLVEVKKLHRGLKVMIACGGWGGSAGFSEMSITPENRKKFVESVVRFIKEYTLDGIMDAIYAAKMRQVTN
jgi:chitinase